MRNYLKVTYLTVKDHGQAWGQSYIYHLKIPPTRLVDRWNINAKVI